MRGFRAVCGRIANIKDSLLERDEFELECDLVNDQYFRRELPEAFAQPMTAVWSKVRANHNISTLYAGW